MKLNQLVTKEYVCECLWISNDSSYDEIDRVLFLKGSKLYVEWETIRTNPNTLSFEETGVGLVKKSLVYFNKKTRKTEDNK